MDKLKTRILQDGKCYEGGILKVDSFINHQMDPNLMMEVAKEFSQHFADAHINKIVTIEASGIAPAILVGYIMQLPVVFIKKKQPKTMDNMLTSVVHSFTKDRSYTVCISADYLTPQDHVLFIDDFLANGNASMGVIDLCKQAGARLKVWALSSRRLSKRAAMFCANKAFATRPWPRLRAWRTAKLS